MLSPLHAWCARRARRALLPCTPSKVPSNPTHSVVLWLFPECPEAPLGKLQEFPPQSASRDEQNKVVIQVSIADGELRPREIK